MPTWISVLVAMAGGALLLVLLLGLALKVILPRVIRKGVGAMFGAKAAALKGAELRVGSVSPADGPPRQAFTNDEDHRSTAETERFGGRWVRIEATVTPRPPVVDSCGEGCGHGFVHWEPDELALCPTPANGKLDLYKLSEDCEIECFVVRPGDGVTPEGEEELEEMKIQGPAQVVLTAYVPNEHRSISLHYYTELVGEPIVLP